MIMDKHKEAEAREAFASLYKKDKEALAELIVEYFDPNHITVDYINMLLNTRNLNPGKLIASA